MSYNGYISEKNMAKASKKKTDNKPKRKRRRPGDTDYVNNKELFEHMKYYIEHLNQAKEEQRDKGILKDDMDLPPVPEYIADCIHKICENMSKKSNFFGYTYREDMVLDGVENCLRYIGNFNPEKSSNPFAYFSQIAHFAFIRRIKSEHKETYVKCKMMELAIQKYDKIGDLNPHDTSNFSVSSDMAYDNIFDFIDDYEEKMKLKKEERKKKNAEKSKKLEAFMDDAPSPGTEDTDKDE